jgi:hypothetical protein
MRTFSWHGERLPLSQMQISAAIYSANFAESRLLSSVGRSAPKRLVMQRDIHAESLRRRSFVTNSLHRIEGSGTACRKLARKHAKMPTYRRRLRKSLDRIARRRSAASHEVGKRQSGAKAEDESNGYLSQPPSHNRHENVTYRCAECYTHSDFPGAAARGVRNDGADCDRSHKQSDERKT